MRDPRFVFVFFLLRLLLLLCGANHGVRDRLPPSAHDWPVSSKFSSQTLVKSLFGILGQTLRSC